MRNKRSINYKLTNSDYCYLAGMIDISSSFFLSAQRRGRKDPATGQDSFRWVGGILIQNYNPLVAHTISEILFLGDTCIHTTTLKSTSGYSKRMLKSIRICGPILDVILPNLIPLLKIKKEHAEIMMQFRKTITTERYDQYNPLPIHVEKLREILSKKISYLNSNEHKDTISSPLSPSSLR